MNSDIEHLEKALQAAPDRWPTRRHLAEHFFNEADYQRAAQLIAEAPELPEDEHERIAAAHFAAVSDPDSAHRILDLVIASNPNSAAAHEKKSEVFEIQGHSEEAAKHRTVASVLGGNGNSESAEVEEVITIGLDDVEEGEDAGATPKEDATPDEPVESAVPRPLAPPSQETPDPPAATVPPPDFGVSSSEETTPDADSEDAPILAHILDDPVDDPLLAEGHLTAKELAELEEEEEAIKKKGENTAKFSAVLISAAVHVVIILLLGLYIIAVPRPPAPEITAIAAPPTDETPEIDKKKVRPTYATQTKPSSKVVPVLTATAYSSVAVPALDEVPPEILVPGLSADDGFGMGISFTGSGDGWVSSLPASVQSRCSLVERMNRLKVGGGSKRCEDAVRRALVYLHENQNNDGSWGKSFPVAMTGLALLAYLGHCETPDSPEFADTVVNAATYLMDTALKNEGRMMSPGGKLAYEHGIGTYALCELFTLSRRGKRKIPDLSALIRQAVPIVVKGQNANGSWNYGYKGPRSDTSVSGWQLQALKAAQNTELDIAGVDAAFEKGMDYLVGVQGPKGGFAYTDDRPEDKISLTGVGVLGLQFGGRGADAPAQKGLDYIVTTRKSLSYAGINFYEWYYSTQACFQAEGKVWEQWNEMFLEPLLEAQDRTGYWPQERSDTTNRQSKGDGEIYRTCLATLMLEVYYRYLPTGEKIKK